jgi:cytochrome c-type biogenesis protein CcmH/NrfG
MSIKRTFLYVTVTFAVLAAGCGKTYMDQQREEARNRWSVSRAEMAARMAEGCLQRGEIGRAHQYIDDLVRSGAPYAPLYVLAARMAADKGDLDTARMYATSARTLDPKSAEARYVLGTIEQTLGRTDEALEGFTEAARLDPTQSRYVLAEAELLVAQDQAALAAENLADDANRMAGRPEIHAALGDVLMLLGQYEQAAGSLRIAVRLAPQRTDLKEQLATALYYSANYAEAESLLGDLAASQPDFAAGWLALMRADCLMAMGRPAQARGIYQSVAQARQDSVAPRLGLAKCDVLDGRVASARKFLEEILALDPRHAEANALMGYALWAEGRPGEAVPHLALALQDPNCAGRETVEQLLVKAQGASAAGPAAKD